MYNAPQINMYKSRNEYKSLLVNPDIQRSFEYNTLDHRWIAREKIRELVSDLSLDQIKKHPDPYVHDLLKLSTLPFRYYCKYYKVLKSDRSLAAITSLCTDKMLAYDTTLRDPEVFHLSHVFNDIIKSNRGLKLCYDCGTNARAAFLKLIEVHRGGNGNFPPLTIEEQKRMKKEYLVTYNDPVAIINKCHHILKSSKKDIISIMSVSVQEFGHVWVIEKRFINGVARYHHYQSSLRSHLLIDFIEHMDYGNYPNQSIDIDQFMDDVKYLMSLNSRWTDLDHRLFAKLFQFLPVDQVTHPKPGFCYTWIQP